MEAAATAPESEAVQSEQGDQGDQTKVHRKELTKVRRASIYTHTEIYIHIYIVCLIYMYLFMHKCKQIYIYIYIYIYLNIYAENAYLMSFERHTGMGQKEETDHS